MDLRQLECVVAVARHEHVTRAAEALHLTQSAVSQHLLRLEAELGVRLFARGPRGTVPTAAGLELLERAEAILHDVERARAAMAGHDAAGPAVVRLVAAPAEVPGLEEALVAALPAGAPAGFAPALRQVPAAEVVDAVRRGTADLGCLALAGPAPAGLDVVPLATDVLVVLRPTAPRRPFTTDLPSSVARDLGVLRERPMLLPAAGTAARQAANAAFAEAGFSPLPRFETSDPAAARDLVAAGLAVGVVPASWANGHGTLTAEPLPAEPVRPVLLHRPDLSRPAIVLADALRALLA